MSKRRPDWETPDWLFDQLHEEFDFTVDASAHAGNHKLPRYWSEQEDGLSQDWSIERVWCNPPYGRDIGRWIQKAKKSGGLAVLLLPVRSETAWWCCDVLEASEIRFVRGRVHFKIDGGANPHPKGCRPVFASAVVVFDGARSGSPLLSSFPTPFIAKRERQGDLFGWRPFL